MGQTNEPSMEEILSSIKRIISEDSESVLPRRARSAPAAEADVLELTQPLDEHEPEIVEVAAEPVAHLIAIEEAPAIAAAPSAPPGEAADALVSSASADATRAALASLSRMVVKPEDPVADNTLEGLVRDLLRPMMREWLDANLPRIVEAAVEREVKRIAAQEH